MLVTSISSLVDETSKGTGMTYASGLPFSAATTINPVLLSLVAEAQLKVKQLTVEEVCYTEMKTNQFNVYSFSSIFWYACNL